MKDIRILAIVLTILFIILLIYTNETSIAILGWVFCLVWQLIDINILNNKL